MGGGKTAALLLRMPLQPGDETVVDAAPGSREAVLS